MDLDLNRSQVATPTERILEYSVAVDYDSLNPSSERILRYIPCQWLNYGQTVFDKRLKPTDSYDGSDPDNSGYLPVSSWPQWAVELVDPSYTILRNAYRQYRLLMTFSETTYDSYNEVETPAHYSLLLTHTELYYVSDTNGNEAEVEVIGSNSGLEYTCADYTCPLSDGESIRFTRAIPGEDLDVSGLSDYEKGLISPQFYYPEYLDGYHVDLEQWDRITY